MVAPCATTSSNDHTVPRCLKSGAVSSVFVRSGIYHTNKVPTASDSSSNMCRKPCMPNCNFLLHMQYGQPMQECKTRKLSHP
eukprot:2541554-Amphidinium_carterae.2